MKTTVYTTHAAAYLTSPALKAMLAIIDWLGWKDPETIVDVKQVMQLTRGHANPNFDFVMVMPDGLLVRTPLELCSWINAEGLAPLA